MVNRPSGTHATAGPGSSAFRVLVVDDDPKVLSSLVAILGDDFDVQSTDSAKRALTLIEIAIADANPFHVVCSDWQMPGMDGLEFFREISQQVDWPSVSCILMTAHPEELVDKVEWGDRKTLGFVRKPFAPEQFVARVRHYASIAEMKRGIRALHVAARNVR
ncbi:MAG TPA: response regulator [Polyangiaceae bacterium]|nr:response regulator [Polyangiaceae bacterium]